MTATPGTKSNEPFKKELDALFLEHREMILNAAYRTTRNKGDAEDVLQTVFLRLIQRPELQSDFCENPKAYLYRAAINEALHVINARERQKLTDDDVYSLEIPALDPESSRDDRIRAGIAAIAAMKPDLVEILKLHYNDGYSCAEIANMRGKRVDAVFKELWRARGELKKAISIQEKQRETQEKRHQTARGRMLAEPSTA